MPEGEIDLETIAGLAPKLDQLAQQLTVQERQQLALVLRAGSEKIAADCGLEPPEVEGFGILGSLAVLTANPHALPWTPGPYGNVPHGDVPHSDTPHVDFI